jgi:hypothetical protein
MTDIPIAECKRGYIYRLHSRNLAYGVFVPEDNNGFIGIRQKFDSRFLFTEYHWENGPPHGTAKPLEEMGPIEDKRILLVCNFPSVCIYCGERVEYLNVDGGVAKHGRTYEGEWVHITASDDTAGLCDNPTATAPNNVLLFNLLDTAEEWG